MERRSPTGIARERETRPNNAAPHMPISLLRTAYRRSALNRGDGSGNADLWSARAWSAKPAPMTVRRTDLSGAPPAQSGLRCSLRFAQRCRPEVGVPVPARHRARGGTRRDASPGVCAPRPEGERGAVAPLSHFPPDHAGSERSSLPLFFAHSVVRHPRRITGTAERRSPTGIARERETRTNNAAPRQSHCCERRIADLR